MNPRLLTVSAIAVAAAIGACKSGSDATGPDSFFYDVIITPSPAAVAVGATLQLHAAVSGPPGTPQGVFWRSIDTAYASVTSTGLVTGKAAGSARIRGIWVEDTLTFTEANVIITDTPVEEGRGASVRRR